MICRRNLSISMQINLQHNNQCTKINTELTALFWDLLFTLEVFSSYFLSCYGYLMSLFRHFVPIPCPCACPYVPISKSVSLTVSMSVSVSMSMSWTQTWTYRHVDMDMDMLRWCRMWNIVLNSDQKCPK
jgi:hypothetical protein